MVCYAFLPPPPPLLTTRLVKEAKRLEADVSSAERALASGPYTVESLQAEADATKALLVERANKRRLLAKQQKDRLDAAKQAEESEAADRAGSPQVESENAHGCPDGPTDGAAEKAAGDVDGVDVLGDQVGAAAKGSALEKDEGDKERDGREEEEEEWEEGLEVEGPFDGEPELRSRFADKSSSLRFVTAEEEARMRKEELVKVFGERGPVEMVESPGSSTVEGGGDVGKGDPGESKAANEAASEAANEAGHVPTSDDAFEVSGVAEDVAVGASDGRWPGAVDVGGGTIKGRMKAMGAILEKTLSQSMLVRAPPPGTAAAAAGVGVSGTPKNPPAGGAAGRRQFSAQPRREPASTVNNNSEKKVEKIRTLSPPCKPKSKFFRSKVDLAPAREDSSAAPQGRPPPPPMLGLLSQIRGARGGGGEAKAVAGGLLAQIRASKAGGTGVTPHGQPGDAGEEKVISSTGRSAPPLPPTPPPSSLQPRSLFGAAEKSEPAVRRGPPPDFFAALRAKAAEKQSLRQAAREEPL